ncbi:hypothetical protein [Ehrlichia japonica]|uniref:Uncharacterized protein n=1 Tax=Ehrlichia japonica TaxID=391036 RepID=X5GIF7_9RICK|nr:hypothetical protein [Ehrlichia japonica]AHX04228.1 hypothetical protein EHF_0239 [Ehrlichia japonica]
MSQEQILLYTLLGLFVFILIILCAVVLPILCYDNERINVIDEKTDNLTGKVSRLADRIGLVDKENKEVDLSPATADVVPQNNEETVQGRGAVGRDGEKNSYDLLFFEDQEKVPGAVSNVVVDAGTSQSQTR